MQFFIAKRFNSLEFQRIFSKIECPKSHGRSFLCKSPFEFSKNFSKGPERTIRLVSTKMKFQYVISVFSNINGNQTYSSSPPQFPRIFSFIKSFCFHIFLSVFLMNPDMLKQLFWYYCVGSLMRTLTICTVDCHPWKPKGCFSLISQPTETKFGDLQKEVSIIDDRWSRSNSSHSKDSQKCLTTRRGRGIHGLLIIKIV